MVDVKIFYFPFTHPNVDFYVGKKLDTGAPSPSLATGLQREPTRNSKLYFSKFIIGVEVDNSI